MILPFNAIRNILNDADNKHTGADNKRARILSQGGVPPKDQKFPEQYYYSEIPNENINITVRYAKYQGVLSFTISAKRGAIILKGTLRVVQSHEIYKVLPSEYTHVHLSETDEIRLGHVFYVYNDSHKVYLSRNKLTEYDLDELLMKLILRFS